MISLTLTLERKRAGAALATRAPGTGLMVASITPSTGDVGNTFTATVSGDTGNPLGAITYQWKRNGAPIAGETAVTYLSVAADDGTVLTVVVTVTNGIGSPAVAASAPVALAFALVAPINHVEPAFSGTAAEGQTLTMTTNGDWEGTPAPTIVTNWQRDAVDIALATASTYVVAAADVGHDIQLRVTGTNSSGSLTAYSAVLAIPVAAVAPANTEIPVVTGTLMVGGTLTGGAGIWTGIPTPTLVRTWQRDSVDISPAEHGESHILVAADEGLPIRLKVVATNTAGSATAYSTAVYTTPASIVAAQYMNEAGVASNFVNAYSSVAEGDLIVCFGFNHSSLTIPSLPTGHTNIDTSSANTSAARLSYKIATGADVGTFWPAPGATRAVMVVIQGFNPADPIGAFSGFTAELDASPGWAALDAEGMGLLLGARGIRGVRSIQAYPGMQVITASGNANASLQAAATAAGAASSATSYTRAGPYTTVPTGDLASFQETLEGNSSGSHTALVEINAAPLATLFAPTLVVLPTISGTPTVGQTLTADSDGIFAGNPAPTTARNWQRDAVDIALATATTYVLVTADAGTQVGLRVTATNSQGEITASSDTVSVAALVTVPVNTVPPSITGTPTVGQTLTAADGTWTGNPAPTMSRKWQRDTVDIASETAATYLLAAGDANKQIRVLVTGTNTAGAASAASDSVVVSAAAQSPVNTVAPTRSNTGNAIGDTITAATDGTWTGTPTPTLARAWQRNNVDISPAETGTTHVIVLADAGQNVRFRVTGTNTAGASTGFCANLAVAVATVPANTAVPTISGSTTQGSTLTVDKGTWTGTPTPTYGYQWLRDGVDIASATNTTYASVVADVGNDVSARVVGSNVAGSATAVSGVLTILAQNNPFNEVTVTVANHLAVLAQTRTRATRYKFSPGTYPDFLWPTNVSDFNIELVPLDRSNPPLIRALAWGNPAAQNFTHLANAASGTVFNRHIKIDGLDFRAERFETMANQDGPGSTSLLRPAVAGDQSGTYGRGMGHRICGTSHPSGNLAGQNESASYMGLFVGGVADADFEVTNCLFDGYAHQFKWNGTGTLDCHHNIWQNLCEDGFKPGIGNFILRDNEFFRLRGPTSAMYIASGHPSGSTNHEDCIQCMNEGMHDYSILRNVMRDDGLSAYQGGFNGGQIRPNNPDSVGTPHYNVRFEGNELRSNANTGFVMDGYTQHGTGIDGTNVDIIIRGNKLSSGGLAWEAGKSIIGIYGSNGDQWNNARVIATNNVAPGCNFKGASGNQETNNETTFPTNWVVKARDKVAAGVAFSGRYGATAGVIPT